MPNLESLHFDHSEIKNIPPEIGKMKQLRSLTLEWDISGTIKSWQMKPVPPEFGELENLCELNLIHCSSFHRGFPAESLNLQNLKSVKFINNYRTLPENTEFLPNLQHLYLSISKINLPEIETVLKEWKTVKTVTIMDSFHIVMIDGSFHRFKELIEKYPQIEFINEGRKLTAELNVFWNETEKLPSFSDFLANERTEKENAQYAYLILKKHFSRHGLELRESDVPFSWKSFSWDLYLNIDQFVSQHERPLMLTDLLAELTDFCEASTGEFFAYKLKVLFKKFIQSDPPRSKFLRLLPEKAVAQVGEIEQMLDDDHERYLEILNQQGY